MKSNYGYTPLYYSTPIRVRYFDYEREDYTIGIAYRDEILTHDGAVIEISTVIINAQSFGIYWDDAVVECDWKDLEIYSKKGSPI